LFRISSFSTPAPVLRSCPDRCFSTGTAEKQADLLDTFVRTSTVRTTLSPEFPLVLGRKGSGKTALFRYLAEGDTSGTIVVAHAPSDFGNTIYQPWFCGPEEFASAGTAIAENASLTWRSFWFYYLSVTLHHASRAWSSPPEPPAALELDTAALGDAGAVPRTWQSLGTKRDAALEVKAWFRSFDQAGAEPRTLLLDGLDTGFGANPAERMRRRESLEGLFSAFTQIAPRLQNIRFKILLREDIWRQLRFENKSHLFGQSKTIEWTNQVEFIQVVIKQAVRSEAFTKLLSREELTADRVDRWSHDEILSAWHLLVGERMRGGRTAFTKNWLWARLADGNGEHSPRYLLRLMQQAVEWERSTHATLHYSRSVIRPRALIDCLETVSPEAVEALQEEFPELVDLLTALAQERMTPVDAKNLTAHADAVSLAEEVGLLEVYERQEEEVIRYKVPDLYRHALGLSRKGQA